ncbi:MAG TPA: S8 family serine peptidase [Acidimicrobiia bacterium]|nr:S8 family serine peptidase [Acidimicrobiia bacterium]
MRPRTALVGALALVVMVVPVAVRRSVAAAQTTVPTAPATRTAATTPPPRIVVTTRDATGRPVFHTIPAATPGDATSVASALHAYGIPAVVDRPVHATGDPIRWLQWPLNDVPYEQTWATRDASGQTVAVVDTGVDATHEDLRSGQVLPGTDLVAPGGNGRVDPNGHGTAVSGVIAATVGNGIGISGAARGARILPVRVLDASGTGYLSDVASGLVWATDHGATVVNMSLAATGLTTYPPVDLAIAYARAHGVVVVAAAGNDGPGSPPEYPADAAGVIAAGATDSSNTVASFSSQGSWVAIAAPGVSIATTWPGNAYVYENGTSFASPYVASAAALVRASAPWLDPDEVRSALTSTATPLGPARAYGAGLVNPLRAVASLSLYHYEKAVAPDRAVAANPKGGGYVLSGNGGVRSFGGAPLFGSVSWGGWQIARSLAVMPDGNGYVVLDAWGGVHRFGSAASLPVPANAYWPGWDVARQVRITPSGHGLVVLDAWGGLHVAGDAPAPTGMPYWFGWDIARDVQITPSGQGYWLLDGWGGVHTSGDARFEGAAPFRSWDIARALVPAADGKGYAILDGFGGVHLFGSALHVVANGYALADVYRGIAVVKS